MTEAPDQEPVEPVLKRLKDRYRWWHAPAMVALLVIGAYFCNFASLNGLSPATEDWARFGEYVGGVIGVLAFVGVLITVDLQRKQLAQLSQQAEVDELHRICRQLALNVDGALAARISPDPNLIQMLVQRQYDQSLRGVLDLVADRSDEGSVMEQIRAVVYLGSLRGQMATARRELNLLASTVQDSVVRGGSPVILAYYRGRYAEVVRRMKVLGYNSRTAEFWAIREAE